MRHPRARTLALAALATLATASPAHAEAGWMVGNSKYQSGSQCFGGNTTGYGANTSNNVSYFTDPDAGYPAVGDRYWIRIHTGAIGFTCPWGASDIAYELVPPNDTATAIDLGSSDPNLRVRCFYLSSSGVQTEVTDKTWSHPDNPSINGKWCDSTTLPSQGQYGWNLGYRLLAQGTQFWVQIPVVSFKRLAGMGAPGTSSQAVGVVSSGVNTFTNPHQWVTVFDRPAAIAYPADHTAPADTTVRTKGQLDAWYRAGKAYVDLGTGAGDGFQVSTQPIAIDGKYPQYTITQDWVGLTPGTDYRWRMRFVADDGQQVAGATKTFRTTGTAPPPGGGGGQLPQPKPPSDPPPPPPDGDGGGGTPPPGGGASPGQPVPNVPAATTPTAPPPEPAAPGVSAATLAKGAGLRDLVTPAGVLVTARCASACSLTARLQVDAATAKRLRLGRKALVIASGRGATTRGGSVALRLKATRKAARKLRRAKSLTAKLIVSAGAASRTTTITLR